MTLPGLDGTKPVPCKVCSRRLRVSASEGIGPTCRRRLHPPPPRRTGLRGFPGQAGPDLLDLINNEGDDLDEPDHCDGWDR